MSQAASEELLEKVCAVISRTLACDPDRVRPLATLVDELGATRFDCERIKYELERAFDVKLGTGSLDEIARGSLSPDEFAPDGLVSAAGLSQLRELIPEAAARIQPGLRQDQVLSLFYVQTLINLVRREKRG
jgi:hypothetical protein